MKRASITDLTVFMAVASHRNFRKAALELGMSPSALSHAVRSLEERLGVRLFNRTTRSVSPTAAGETLFRRLTPAMRDIMTALDEVDDFRSTPSGTLRINASASSARVLMQPMLARFLARFPDMRVEVVTEDRLVDIVAEGFDAGVRLLESVPQDMIAVPFGPDLRLIAVASPDYLKQHGTPKTPQDLARHDCINYRLGSGRVYRWEFSRHGQDIQIDAPGKVIVDNPMLILDAALAGVGVALTMEALVAADIAAGRLVPLLEEWCQPFAGLCLYYPGRRHMPAGLRAFIDMMRETSFPAAT
ncbi:LysR family transcriptional regulator (plasmid) [Tistrella bauzanensis]|jgi:DNA-binding transcriptional LysR family regulator|uniref:LysR family transcriptional regulator n=1 Tax=Tistrella arctica TaxID=3133430 RepID=A0ABU9YRS8_9PROT